MADRSLGSVGAAMPAFNLACCTSFALMVMAGVLMVMAGVMGGVRDS